MSHPEGNFPPKPRSRRWSIPPLLYSEAGIVQVVKARSRFAKRTFTHPAFLCFGSGLIMGIAPAPVNLFPLAWIALVPLWLLCVRVPWRKRLVYGAFWGFGYHGLALFWITGLHPMTWMGVPWLTSLAIALFCWLFITAWGMALVMIWCVVWPRLAAQSRWLNWLWAIALWCGLERLWQASPLWWSSLAYTQSPLNLWVLHWSQIGGPSLVTAILVGFNGLVALALTPNPSPSGRGAFPTRVWAGILGSWLLVAIAGGYLITQLSWPAANPPQPLTVGIIQGNIPNEIKLYPAGWRKAIAGYRAGYLELASQGVDAILTPETALPYQWNSLVRDRHPFYRAIEQVRVPVWVGGFGKRAGRWTNSLFAVTADGQTLSRYDKVKLVPLGEYIPFESLLGRFMGRLSPLDAMLAPGDPTQIFLTPFGDAIAGICYESAFPEHFRRQTAAGGEFILTASNNAHYSAAMPAQHHAMDVMRAIENDRWAVRATNTGYSAIVDPHGQTLWRSGLNVYAIHAETVERRTSQTPYVRWGNLFLWSFLTITLVIHGLVYDKSLLNRKR